MTLDLDILKQALVASRILSERQLASALAGLPSNDSANTVVELARLLQSRGVLTEFQAEHLQDGRWNELVVGNYVLRRPVQQGGMGQLYEAWHPPLRRVVAIKSISARALARNEELLQRFDRELQACGRLNHENIVTIHDAVVLPSGPWLVMEKLDGRDLFREVSLHGAMPPQPAIEVGLQAAHGLAHAHRGGVIHRDVKPANLFLEKTGTVRVLDFGLAMLQDAVASSTEDAPQLTGSGVVVGTAEFMAPEQAIGGSRVDARADIYSLGCTLYFLLTGRTPFHQRSPIQQIIAHREQDVPDLPESLASAPLNRVLHRMMEKQPEVRQQTMEEVIGDLSELRAAGDTDAGSTAQWSTQKLPSYVAPATSRYSERSPRPTRVRTLVMVALATLTLVALTIVAGWWNPRPPAGTWDELRLRLQEANPGLKIPQEAYQREDDLGILTLSRLTKLRELVSLGNVPIDMLYLDETRVHDLTPLANSRLQMLDISGTDVSSLAPLEGLALNHLALWRTPVTDIEALHGMRLEDLDIHGTAVSDLSPLAEADLVVLDVHETLVEDLSIVANMPLALLDTQTCPVRSLNAVRDCPLQRLWCDAKQIEGIDIVATWPRLREVNDLKIEEFLEQQK